MILALEGVLFLAAVLGAMVWGLGIAVLAALVTTRSVTPRACLAVGVTPAAAGIGDAGLAALVGALVIDWPGA